METHFINPHVSLIGNSSDIKYLDDNILVLDFKNATIVTNGTLHRWIFSDREFDVTCHKNHGPYLRMILKISPGNEGCKYKTEVLEVQAPYCCLNCQISLPEFLLRFSVSRKFQMCNVVN